MKTFVKKRGRSKLSHEDHEKLSADIQAAEATQQLLKHMYGLVASARQGKVHALVLDRIIGIGAELDSGLSAIRDALQKQMCRDCNPDDPRVSAALYYGGGGTALVGPKPFRHRGRWFVRADGGEPAAFGLEKT